MEKNSGKKDLGKEDSRKNEATCEDGESTVRDKTLYGNVFHRNVCWQRSYQKPEGEELIMALYGSLRNGLYNSRRFDLQNRSEFLGTTTVRGYSFTSFLTSCFDICTK